MIGIYIVHVCMHKLHSFPTSFLYLQLGNIPLHYVSSEGHLDTALLLIQQGADVYTTNNVS